VPATECLPTQAEIFFALVLVLVCHVFLLSTSLCELSATELTQKDETVLLLEVVQVLVGSYKEVLEGFLVADL
jgi:hypothetical protein